MIRPDSQAGSMVPLSYKPLYFASGVSRELGWRKPGQRLEPDWNRRR